MKKEENKKSVLSDIAAKKKELMILRVKKSSGDSILLKNYRQLRKDIARLFTKLNSKKSKA